MMNYRTRSESMLIALVSIPEAIVRLLTLCYVSPRWVDNLSVWSLRKGVARAKRVQAEKELAQVIELMRLGMKLGQPHKNEATNVCLKCLGTGRHAEGKCYNCRGKGFITLDNPSKK
jgi:hypothetical protein